MILIKKFLANNFYFWLLGLSVVLISYFSIYNSLVIDNSNNSEIIEKVDSRISLSLLKQGLSYQYLLIPVNFIKLFTFFSFGQIIAIYLFQLIYKIQNSSKLLIFSTYLLGCVFCYFLTKLFKVM